MWDGGMKVCEGVKGRNPLEMLKRYNQKTILFRKITKWMLKFLCKNLS